MVIGLPHLLTTSGLVFNLLKLFYNFCCYYQVVSFRTLSPPLTNLTRHLRGSSVQVQGKQVVVVRWAAITCADQYKVYAKYQAWGPLINNADTDKCSCNNVMLHLFVKELNVK